MSDSSLNKYTPLGGTFGPETPGHDPKHKPENIQIPTEFYQIKISTTLFYSKLGRYPQIMRLFQICGFEKVEKHMSTTFNFLKESDDQDEVEHAWKDADSDEEVTDNMSRTKSSQPMESEDLMAEFKVNRRFQPKDR